MIYLATAPHLARATFAAAILAGSLAPVGATDAELQAALRGANCGSPTIKEVLQRGDFTVFEANCSRTSHRVLTVTCGKSGCHVDEPEPEPQEGR